MLRLSQWLYRLAMTLYPAELRREYGIDMARAFRDEVRAAGRQGGVFAILRLWPKTFGDIVRTKAQLRRDIRAAAPVPPPTGGPSNAPAPRESIMESLFTDVRHGIRNFIGNPGFAAATTLTLAIGVGAAVTMFSGLSNFVLEPLPFAEQDELQMVWSAIPERGVTELGLSYLDYLDYRDSGALEDVAAWYLGGHNLSGGDNPVRIQVVRASASLFPLLGVEAAAGRPFSAAEDADDEAVVLISNNLWERQFGADPDIVGKTLRLDGNPYVVVGVMPSGFWFPTPQYDAWLPLDLPTMVPRSARFLGGLGKVAVGSSRGEALATLNATAAALAAEYPGTNEGVTAVNLTPLITEVVMDEMRYSLYILTVTGVAVLLIACVNIANLLVARGLTRRREIAVRAALGARRVRLVRQYLTENLILGVTGGGLGIVIAAFGISGIAAALSANEPGRIPRLEEYLQSGMDARVMAFAVLASLAAVAAFGLIPALHSTRGNLHGGLQDCARGTGAGLSGGKLQKTLVVVEMALTIGLLIGAGMALRSYGVVQATDPGMERRGLLTMAVALPSNDYAEEHEVRTFFDQALAAIRQQPGIVGASATSSLPAARQGAFRGFEIEGRVVDSESDLVQANRAVVAPGYFGVLGTAVIQGRALLPADDVTAAPVVVINQTMARAYWPDQEAIGARVRLGGSDEPWAEVVGVVGDIKNNGLHRRTWPALYLPLDQSPLREMSFVVRTGGEATSIAPAVRNALATVDGALPIFRVMSMERVYANRYWGETLTMKLLAWCAVGALLLAVVGIYGVISYSVTQRRREMGIRIALGAGHREVISLVVRQGLWLVAGGIGFGLFLGFGLSRGLSFMLFGVNPNDPTTYLAVVAFVACAAIAASYIPARRATRVDPIVTLRED